MKRAVVAGMLVMLVLVLGAGCTSVPNTVSRPRSLKGDKVIFFEQSDRIPKDVLLAANKEKTGLMNAMIAIPPDVIAKVIEEILKVAPEIAKTMSEESMNNSLIQRRILLKGYSGQELKDVIDIIKAFNGSIEFITPQDDGQPKVQAWDNEGPKKK